MDIVKIVFTGGPCAGKTTLINSVQNYLRESGYNVIVVPETATLLKEAGINFKLLNNVISFQKFILKMQLFNERLAYDAAKVKNDKIIILYDRGVLDNKSYCGNYEIFNNLLNEEQIEELDKLDDYNIVFDLITLADCNPSKYTLENNKQREETPEEAIVLDRKTSNAWTGHRNIRIINTNISEDEVFEIVKNEINNLLTSESKKEIKKYDIVNVLEDFYEYDDNNSRLIKIEEIKLLRPIDNINYNLYKRTYKGCTTYIFKVFKEENNIITTYYDEKISAQNYLELIAKYNISEIINYNQLSFIENRQEYNIKFYGDNTVLEYEENKLNKEFVLPKVIKLKDGYSSNKQLLKK